MRRWEEDLVRLANGEVIVDELGHAYDPRKAHEYYMRVRKLHPRQKGLAAQPVASLGKVAKTGLTGPKLRKQQQAAAHRVATLQKKLSELNKALKDKMAEAKKEEQDANKKPTAADKAKTAREAKKYRDTHKTELKNKAKQAAAKSGGSSTSTSTPKKSAADQVKDIKAAITTVQNALTAAKAQQRALG
jgi:chromosome segregation ATPase